MPTVTTALTAPPLRGYQQIAVDITERAVADGERRMYLSMPTGTGKTRCLGELAHRTRVTGGRVLAVVHTRELCAQLARGLSAATGEHVGVVMAGDDAPAAGVVVGSVQTLRGRRLDDVLDAGPVALLLVDEAHHITAGNSYGKLVYRVAARYPDVAVVGVTATPYRADREQMQTVLPRCVFERSIPQMTEAGVLAPLSWDRAELDELDLSAVGTGRDGGERDYREVELAALMGSVVEQTVQATAPLLTGRLTVVFAVDVRHAHALAEAYRNEGVSAATVWGAMAAADRERVLGDWRAGRVQVVVNVNVVAEGFDLPELSAVVIARPTRSPGRYVQMIGRVSRTFPGKADALVIDVTGSPFGPHSIDPGQITLGDLLGERAGEPGSEVGVEQGEQLGRRRPHWLVDPAGASPLAWGLAEQSGCYFAKVDDRTAMLLRGDPDGSGLFGVWLVTTRGERKVRTNSQLLPLRDAVGVAVAAATRVGRLSVLLDTDAPWRTEKATVPQLNYLSSLDPQAAVQAREGRASKGEVNMAITWREILKTLRSRRLDLTR